MKIRFITGVAGARFAYEPGDEVDLRVDVAREFVKAGQAVIVPEVEAAVAAPAPETAVTRSGSRKRSIRNLGGLLPG